jgi:hypothetical protein
VQMSDKPEHSETGVPEEVDPGEPILALAELKHDASSGLVPRIRRTIQRRTTVAQLASFSVSIPLLLLREIWSILINRPNRKNIGKDSSRGEKTS